MTETFATLIPEARSFLAELAQNNSRAWFTENKTRYEAQLKSPALALLDVVGTGLGKSLGAEVTPKLFRPHRDVRFSKDKTPYHTHLHLLWTSPAPQQPIGWFFGLAPGYLSIGAGLMGFDKSVLTAYRAEIDGENAEALLGPVEALTKAGYRISEPELKRVPAPYDKDHPRGQALRRKSLSAWKDLEPEATIEDLPETILEIFDALTPLARALTEMQE